MGRILLILLALTFSTQAQATDFYVDPVNGSMTNDGSQANPWSTLQEVWEGDKISSRWCRGECPDLDADREYYISNPDGPVKAGDTINLMGGHHGEFIINNRYNTDFIYIKAVDAQTPTLTSINMTSVSYWSFDGLSISPEHGGDKPATLFGAVNHAYTGKSNHIILKNSELFSASDSSGWTTKQDWKDNATYGVRIGAKNTELDNLDIKNVTYGVNFSKGAHYGSLRNSTLTNMSMDGIWVFGADYVKVEYNVVKNIFLVAVDEGAHYDLFQTASTGGTMTGLEVRGNIFIAHEDPNQPLAGNVQGIGMFDGWYADFVIENNLVISDSYHGITLTGAINCKILNNTVVPTGTPGLLGVAPIGIYDHKSKDENGVRLPSYGNVIANNIASYLKGTEGIEVETNNIWTSDKAAHFVDAANFDYRLNSSSSAIDTGSTVYFAPLDLLKLNRDALPDVGAYESNGLLEPITQPDPVIDPDPQPDPVEEDPAPAVDTSGVTHASLSTKR